MNRIIVALASLLIVTTPLAGCLDEATLEEIIDDIVGCMDTQAKNYDEMLQLNLLEIVFMRHQWMHFSMQ